MYVLIAFLTPILHALSCIVDAHFSNNIFKKVPSLVFYATISNIIIIPFLFLFGTPIIPPLEILAILFNLLECPLAITIINNNRESLINVLREYVNFYKSKKLIEPGDINTFETFEHLHNDLMLLVKDARVDITKYKLNDIKFAPVILANYFINNDFIGELLIDTAEPENAPYTLIHLSQFLL